MSAALGGTMTLGLAADPYSPQWPRNSKQKQTSCMKREQFCPDPQNDFAFIRESLGVSRANHIHRYHPCRPLLVAAKPRIQAMIHDASTAGILRDELRLDCLKRLMETATTTFRETVDHSEEGSSVSLLAKGSFGREPGVAADCSRRTMCMLCCEV